MEEQKAKKPYEKPAVTRIRLDAQCAVLGFCKASGSGGGPAGSGGACKDSFSNACLTYGS